MPKPGTKYSCGADMVRMCVCVCVCVNEADKAQSSRWKRVGFVRDVFLLGEKARVDMRSGGVGGGVV